MSARFRCASSQTGSVKAAIAPKTVINPGIKMNEVAVPSADTTKITVVNRRVNRASQTVFRFRSVVTTAPSMMAIHNAANMILVAASATPGNGWGMTRAKTRNTPKGVIEVIRLPLW